MLNGLDLFSGIGGLTVALSEWCRPVAYCEADKYAQALLLSRMSCGDLPRAPIWNDVQTLNGNQLQNIDIIYGGFPCQDISVAGNGVGLEGKRSGLFYEIVRLVKETNAPWVFLENVPAIRTKGLSTVIEAFTDLGYDCRWTCVSAAEVGAPHLRKRWFLLAHSNGAKLRDESGWRVWSSGKGSNEFNDDGSKESVAHTTRKPKRKQTIQKVTESVSRQAWTKPCVRDWWATEPDVGRVADGIRSRVDRIKGLGNAVVPAQARESFEKLMGLHEC